MKNKRLSLLLLILLLIITGLFLIPLILTFLKPRLSSDEMLVKITYSKIESMTEAVSNFVSDCSDIFLLDDRLDRLCVNHESLPGWNGPYLSFVEELNDLWGNQYKLIYTEGGYILISAGIDGLFFTEDDIKGTERKTGQSTSLSQP